MNRREFLEHTVAGGAMMALGASTTTPLAARAVKWPIGCFNRPWTTWSYDDALKQMKAAGYETTGLLRERSRNLSSAPTPRPTSLP